MWATNQKLVRGSSHFGSSPHARPCCVRLSQYIPSSTATAESQTDSQLLDFVLSKGGILHPSLSITSPSPGVVKGIVTTAPVLPDAILFQLPVSLRITSDHARQCLESMGLASSWHPYLASMPQSVSCGWAKSDEEVDAEWKESLYALGMDVEWWKYFLSQAREEIKTNASRLVAAYGPILSPPGGAVLTVEDVMWGVGHAMSRKFESDGQVFLEPLSDLLNLQASWHPHVVRWTYASSTMGKASDASAVASAGNGDGDIVVSRAMLRPGSQALAGAYLLHGYVPADILEKIRMRAVASALLPYSNSSGEEADAEMAEVDAQAQYESPGAVPPTQLYDYLTPQYQDDVGEVLDIVFTNLIQREQEGGPRAYSEQPIEVVNLVNLLRQVPYPRGSASLPELIGQLDASVIEVIDLAEAM
eukprot:gene31319-6466_t